MTSLDKKCEYVRAFTITYRQRGQLMDVMGEETMHFLLQKIK